MSEKPSPQTALGVSTQYSPKPWALYSVFILLGASFVQVLCTPLPPVPEGIKAPETVHGVLGINAGPMAVQVPLKPSKTLANEHNTVFELSESYEQRPVEKSIAENTNSIRPISSEAQNLDNSAFSIKQGADLSSELRTKSLKDLPELIDKVRVNPHLNDQALSIKDEYLDAFFQMAQVIERDQSSLRRIVNNNVDYVEKIRALVANLKASLVNTMRYLDKKASAELIQTLRNIPEAGPVDSESHWVNIIITAEKRYNSLYAKPDSLIVSLFKQCFQSSKWREDRMLKDFQKIRMVTMHTFKTPNEQLILKLEEFREFGIKLSRGDQNVIHKIATKGDRVKLSRSDVARLEKLQERHTEILDLITSSGMNQVKSGDDLMPNPTILQTKESSGLEQPQKELLAKLQVDSIQGNNVQREVSPIERYSNRRALQINEMALDSKFTTQTRAREVLQHLSDTGAASEAQKQLLSQLKDEEKMKLPSIYESSQVLAEAFWERQSNLLPEQKAQWMANLITPDLQQEFSIKSNFLERIKNLPPNSELNNLEQLQIKHLAEIHDEVLVAMSKQERAFQELVARYTIRGGKEATERDKKVLQELLGQPTEESVQEGTQPKSVAKSETIKEIYDQQLKQRFREVSYARLHWTPTKEDRALERLRLLSAQGRDIPEQQKVLLEKLEKRKPLSEKDHQLIKQLAIDSVLSQDFKGPLIIQERAFKLVQDSNLNDLSDYDLKLFQNLKKSEILELVKLDSLKFDHQIFATYSKFIRISQILKRAEERRSLNITPNEANQLYWVMKNQINNWKLKLVSARESTEYLQRTFELLTRLKTQHFKDVP